MGEQYFDNNGNNIVITDIYDIIKENFPNYNVYLIDYISFLSFPKREPLLIPEKIKKRIVLPSAEIIPFGISPPIGYLINSTFFIIMLSEYYYIIIQYTSETKDNFSFEKLLLSYYYINQEKLNNNLEIIMKEIKYCLLNNFSGKLTDENILELYQKYNL